MVRFRKILRWIVISTVGVALLCILLLALAIPYGRMIEKAIEDPGQKYSKIVLTNANLLTMTSDTVMYAQNIYLENGEIAHITKANREIRAGYQEIDLEGAYVMPGLIDMHVHIFDRSDLPLCLSYGVTTVRNMMGFPMHLRWKDQLKDGTLIGSNLITATPTMNSGDNAGPFHKVVDTPQQAASTVKKYISKGYDFVKVYDDISGAQLAAIDEVAHGSDVDIAGHPPKIPFEELLVSPLVSIEHIEELRKFLDEENSIESIRHLAQELKKADKTVTINLVPFNRIYRTAIEGESYWNTLEMTGINPVIKFIGEKQLGEYTRAGPKYKEYATKKYNTLATMAKALHDEGVHILFGTDCGPNFIAAGRSVLEEIDLLSEAGIPTIEILKSATVNAAKTLRDDDIGTIAVGRKAELLVLGQNPIEDLKTFSEPRMLIKGDAYYEEDGLQALRSIGENKQSTYATIGLFLEHLLTK